MHQRDWLLAMIERIAEAIGAYLRGGDAAQLEEAVQEITGLGLSALERMPAPMLIRMVRARSDGADTRMTAVADVLDALAERAEPDRAQRLREKADQVRRS